MEARVPAKNQSPVAPLRWTVPRRPLGAHMSIAGGVELALQRASSIDCTAVQLFTKSSNQWAARPLSDESVRLFHEALDGGAITHVVAHDSYLINLCSPDDALWERSIDACAAELGRCALLRIPWLIAHPGGHMGRGEEYGIARMAEAIDRVHAQIPAARASLALETTAGQGTILGHRFEQIAAVIRGCSSSGRIGVCLDTCHLFAAGYDLRTAAGYDDTMRRFGDLIGFDRLVAVHVNDSKKDLGCRVDRHEHIGRGFLGLEAFRHLMNDPRLQKCPLILETPKGPECREDVENLTTLLALVEGRRPAAAERRRSAGRRAGARNSGGAPA